MRIVRYSTKPPKRRRTFRDLNVGDTYFREDRMDEFPERPVFMKLYNIGGSPGKSVNLRTGMMTYTPYSNIQVVRVILEADVVKVIE